MIDFFESIFHFLSQCFEAMGYFGMALGMFIESCCIPLPSEIILPVAGNMIVPGGSITMFGANLAVAIGSLGGSLLAYYIGYFGGRPLVINLIEKYGKYIFITMEHFEKAEQTFIKYGNATVCIGRLLPIIRTFISLPAGIAKMNVVKFMLYSMPPMILWNYLLIYAGYKLRENYSSIISPYIHQFDYLVVGVCLLVFGFIVYKFISHYRKMKRS